MMLATSGDALRYAGHRITSAAARVQHVADFLATLRARGVLPGGPINATSVAALKHKHSALWKLCMASA